MWKRLCSFSSSESSFGNEYTSNHNMYMKSRFPYFWPFDRQKCLLCVSKETQINKSQSNSANSDITLSQAYFSLDFISVLCFSSLPVLVVSPCEHAECGRQKMQIKITKTFKCNKSFPTVLQTSQQIEKSENVVMKSTTHGNFFIIGLFDWCL